MKGKLAALAASAVVLSGCTSINFSVDGLLAAPKLTSEQSEIHEALINAVGNNLTLKYPKNGANRSAYVIADIDDEPGDEALVFYEYTGSETNDDGLRVNLLDKDADGRWQSVKEIAGAGTDVDKVIITPMGTDNHTNVLVGYQTLSGEEKALEIYSYRSGDFKRIGTSSYSVLETFDINSDGSNELVTVRRQNNTETGLTTSTASLLTLNKGEDEEGKPTDVVTLTQSIDMCDNVSSYARAVTGRVADGRNALYIDAVDGEGNLHTEMVYYRYSALQNPMQIRSEKLIPECTRPAGYYAADIDGDGIIEIPVTRPLAGYENSQPEDQQLLTSWTQYTDFYELTEKFAGYYAVSDGYTMIFPSRWTDKVTVKKDSITNETVFYKFEGDINAEMTELMRIAVVPKTQAEEFTFSGYQLITSAGQLDYLVLLPTNKREQLILTIDEVTNNLYVIES